MTTSSKVAAQAVFATTLGLALSFYMANNAIAQTTSNPATKPVSSPVKNPQTPAPTAVAKPAATLNAPAQAANATAQASPMQAVIAGHHGGWSMFLQNPCHTGQASPDLALATSGKVRWTFPAEGTIDRDRKSVV